MFEEPIKILTPLPNLNTIFLAGLLLESNKFFRNIYNSSEKKLKIREPNVQLIPFHLQIIKSQIEKDKEEAKNDIYGVIKQRDTEMETPYIMDKIEAGQTQVVSQVKEIDKEAISQVTLLSDTEGQILKEAKNGTIKEVYVKIKANYMFIYDLDKKGIINSNSNNSNNNQMNQKQRYKSVKILNLCYLKYEKNEDEDINNDYESSMNISNLNMSSNNASVEKKNKIKKKIIKILYFALN